MKPIIKLSLFIITLICYTTNSYAQEWYNMMHQEPINIEAVKQKAETYFDKIGRGKHTGYKQYNRWLTNAITNMDKNGVPYTNNHIAAELQKFRANTSIRQQETPTLNASSDANNNWTSIGPSNYKENNENKNQGRITAIAVEPIDQQLLIAGTPGGGLWRSRDAGTSWEPIGDQFDNMNITAVGIDPYNNNHIVYLNNNSEVFESLDQGDTWKQIANFNSAFNLSKMFRFHPTTPNLYFVTTVNGLMKTIDGGVTFTKVINGNIDDVFFKPGEPTTMYSTGNDFWKSTNSGDTWTKITNGINVSDRMKMTVTLADPNRVYIIQADGSNGGFRRIYKSTNSGASFEVMADAAKGAENYINKQAWRCMTIMGSTTDPDKLHMGGFEHFRSDDGGATIYEVPNSQFTSGAAYIHVDVLTMKNVNGTLYVTSDGGLYRSTDNGVNYIPLAGTELNITQFFRLGGTSPYPGTGEGIDPNMIIAGCLDNGTKISKGANNVWENFTGGDGQEAFIDYTNSDVLYASAQLGTLYSSIDGGATRIAINEPESQGSSPTPYTMDPLTHTSVYAGFRDLYISKNAGKDWEMISSGQTDGSLITSLAISATDPNYIYFSDGDRLWVSRNAQSTSKTWTEVNVSALDRYLNYITVDPNDPLHALVVSTGAEVYETKNGGQTWNDISGNLPDIGANCVLMDNSPENRIYIGMTQGVYYKDDTMADWKLFGQGLPKVEIKELEMHYQSNKLRVATFGRGIWEIPVFGNESTPTNSLAVSSLNEFNADGDSQTITVTSNIDWTVSENSAWISVNKTSGSNEGTVSVTTSENTSTQSRSATITITGGAISRTITVSQAGAEEIITNSLTVSSLNEFNAGGDSQTITVTSNIDWTVSENSAWISVNKTSGSNEGTVSVTANENTSTESRSATITITGGAISRTLTISQSGSDTTECITPTGLNISNLSNTNATLNWDAVTGASSYDVHFSATSANTWTTFNNVTATSKIITDLSTNDIEYEFEIRANCSNGDSDYSDVVKFGGTSDCEIPTNLNVTNISTNNATLNWDAVTGASSYDVHFSTTTANKWTTYNNVTATSKIITDLSTNDIEYEFEIRANCSNGDSDYSDVVKFGASESSTPVNTSSCDEETNLSVNATIVDFSAEQNTNNTVENLIDDIDNNRWSVFEFPQYATIDLGDQYNVNEINLATYLNRDYQFIVEGSTTSATDGFFTLTDATNNTATGPITKTFTAQTVRYVKLTITGANSYTGSWSSIADFKIICAGGIANKNNIDGQTDLFEITAYPNPCIETITIKANNSDYAIDNIQLVDITGRVILQKSINADEETTLTDLDGINNGIYLLLVFNAQEQILKTIKIVKE